MEQERGQVGAEIRGIENPSLRIKVACVMLWDCTHHDVVEGRDFTLLKSYADKWKPQVEAEFEEEDLVEALRHFKYPAKIARKRAVPPKTNIDYRGGKKMKSYYTTDIEN